MRHRFETRAIQYMRKVLAILLLKLADREITDDTGIAESMNTYFSYVFTNEAFENFPTISRVLNEELSDI